MEGRRKDRSDIAYIILGSEQKEIVFFFDRPSLISRR